MTFKLPKIDPKKTKDAVESALEKYRIFMLQVSLDRLPQVTASYSLQPPSFGNEFHSSTEEAAVANVDYEKPRMDYMSRIMRAVNRLSYQERSIIVKRYMEDEMFDYHVYNEVGMSERNYYRIKGRAFYKLAFLLKIEVSVEEESDNKLCPTDS